MKVIYTSTKNHEALKLDQFPNAGPNPSISGMRKIYGENSYLVKCGRYLYNVDRDTYYRAEVL